MERKYAAFISYRHLPADMKIANTLHKMIEHYIIPRDLRESKGKRLGKVFRDLDELPLSNDLTRDIYDALDNSEYLIVVCTPETPKSKWVLREIEYFISMHGRNRVFVVLAEGTMQESVPEQIINVYAEDGTTVIDQIEPLVAMIADETLARVMRRLRKEFLRLVAGMLGVSYDSLYQRNKRYQMRRMAVFMMLVIALGTAFMGILYLKNQELSQKNEEIAQKNQQIHEQLLATQLSESYSMAQLSLQALEEGNENEAIRMAMAVLPSDGNERPFCPDAQYALTQALHAYEEEGVYPIGHIRQATQIEDIAVSANGRYAVTLDNIGMLRGFDLHTLQQIWEKESGSTTGFSSAIIRFLEQNDLFLFTTAVRNQFENGNLILYSDPNLFRCIDAATGNFLGEATKPYNLGPDGSIAVSNVKESYRKNEYGTWTTDFALYDTTSGEILDIKALPDADTDTETILSADYKRLLVVDNDYSPEMKNYHLVYRFYDLESCKLLNETESSWRFGIGYYLDWMYAADGSIAVICIKPDQIHHYVAVDMETGRVAWEQEFLFSEKYLNDSGMYPLEDGSIMLWAVDRATETDRDMVYCRRIAADGTVIMQDSKECDKEDHAYTFADPYAYENKGLFHFFASGYDTSVIIDEGILSVHGAYYHGNYTILDKEHVFLDSCYEVEACTALLDTLNENGLYCAEDVSWENGTLCVATNQMKNEFAVLKSFRNPHQLALDAYSYDPILIHEMEDRFTARLYVREEGSLEYSSSYATVEVPSLKMKLHPGFDSILWDIVSISADGSQVFTEYQTLHLESGTEEKLVNPCSGIMEDVSNFEMLPRGYDTARNPTIYAMWSQPCQTSNGENHLHLWIDGEEIKSPPLDWTVPEITDNRKKPPPVVE